MESKTCKKNQTFIYKFSIMMNGVLNMFIFLMLFTAGLFTFGLLFTAYLFSNLTPLCLIPLGYVGLSMIFIYDEFHSLIEKLANEYKKVK